jgi:hypothetical protein
MTLSVSIMGLLLNVEQLVEYELVGDTEVPGGNPI